MTATVINLSACEYDKKNKALSISNSLIEKSHGGRYPRDLLVHSHHTGRIIRFQQIQEGHPMFDYDFWDGEMMVYEPVSDIQINVRTLTIHNFY